MPDLTHFEERRQRILLMQQDLKHLAVDELLCLARDRGLRVYTVDNPKAKTFGHYRVDRAEGRPATETDEIWLAAVRPLLFDRQLALPGEGQPATSECESEVAPATIPAFEFL